MKLRALLSMVLLVAATATVLPGAAAQDDAGTGADAPDSCAQAQDVTRGTSFQGTLDDPDGAEADHDWYRVEVPDGKMIVIRAEPLGNKYVDIDARDDSCSWVSEEYGYEDGVQMLAANPESSSFVRFQIETFYEDPVDYRIETEAFDVPDPMITEVEIEEEPIRTAVASTPTGTQRTVHVTVKNDVAGNFPPAFDEEYLDVEVHHDNGERRELGYAQFDPFRQEPTTLSFEWDGTGELGDVTVEAEFWNGVDQNRENNRETKGSYVLVGGTGYGVDTLNREDEVRVGATEVEYESEYGYWGQWTVLEAEAPGAQAGPIWLDESRAGVFFSDDSYDTDVGGYAYTPMAEAAAVADDGGVSTFACVYGPAGSECVSTLS